MTLPVTTGAGALTPAEHRDLILAKARKMREAGEAPKPREGGKVFAKIDGNTGAFTAGREKTPVEPDQQFVVVIENCLWGWRFWKDKKPERELMVPVLDAGQPHPPENEPKAGDLPKPREREGWNETVDIVMSGFGEGELEGITVDLSCSNKSSLGTSKSLMGVIFQQMETPDGQKGLFNPIIRIAVNSYENKDYSRDVYYPEFTILEWTDGKTRIPAMQADDGAAGLLD